MAAFNFNQSAFPILTPQQSSPLGGVLSDAIAKRLAMAQAQKAEAEAPFAGISSLAKAMSQTSYANLMGPQFAAKLIENPLILPSIKDPQKRTEAILNMVGGSGNQSFSASNIAKGLLSAQQANQQNPLGDLGRGLLSWFGVNQPQQAASTQQVSSPMQQSTSSQIVPQPSAQGYATTTPAQTAEEGIQTVTPGNASPAGRSAENVAFINRAAEAKSELAKSEESGKEAGKQQAEYGEEAAGVFSQSKALKNLQRIFQNPELENIANIPFANQRAISWYKNTGTTAQKRAIGEMDAAMNSYIASSFKSFGSRGVTNKDLMFLQSMKPNDNDLMDVRKGKLVALETYNESDKQRIKIAHKYMKNGMDKTDAEDLANDMVDMSAIEQKAYNEVYPPPVKIKTRKGSVIELPKRGADKLLKEHPDYEVVQ